MLKGVLFWRWAGGDPSLDMSSENEATTLGDTFLHRPLACFVCAPLCCMQSACPDANLFVLWKGCLAVQSFPLVPTCSGMEATSTGTSGEKLPFE